MEIDLENLSKKELISLLIKSQKSVSKSEKLNAQLEKKHDILEAKAAKLEEKNVELQHYVDLLRRMQFGQKRERFEDPNQTELPLGIDPEILEEQQELLKQEITYARTQKKHPGRAKLPDTLPVQEIEIHPEGDLTDKVCIGKEISDVLDYVPGYFKIKRYIRYKYADKDKELPNITIGLLPDRIIERGIPSNRLLASLLVFKYLDHLPLYRQRQIFQRANIDIAPSTIDGWAAQGMDALKPLYTRLVGLIKNQDYLQVDETTIKVLDEMKKGKTHLGYYWTYHAPKSKLVLFDYNPGRAGKYSEPFLGEFKGYLQVDGFSGYLRYGQNSDITTLSCWAHARREFEKALSNDKVRATHVLLQIQQLYALERKAVEQNMTTEQIKELRLTESLPIINELGKYIFANRKLVLPKSQIGKAFAYTETRWDNLSNYLQDGNLCIDNNPIENAIRPIALGRKNYLFAGSHAAAQRAAMVYTFFANCKKNDVNPQEWLEYTLDNIQSYNHKNIEDLLPNNYKNLNKRTI